MRQPGVFEAHRREHRFEHAAEGGEIWRRVGEADVDHPGHDLDMDRTQRMLAGIEAVRHLAGIEQRAIKVVGPLMIGHTSLAAQPVPSWQICAPR